MGIILDIILVAIIALNVFICYKKGLVKLAVGLIAVLVSVILAVLLYKPVSNIIINNTELDEKIKSAITENFVNEEEKTEETEDNGFMKYIEKYVEDPVNKTKNEIGTGTSDTSSIYKNIDEAVRTEKLGTKLETKKRNHNI